MSRDKMTTIDVRVKYADKDWPPLYRVVGLDANGREVPGTREEGTYDLPPEQLGNHLFKNKMVKRINIMMARTGWEQICHKTS